MSQLLLGRGQRLVFIGDSITDAGRSRESPYGSGYAGLVRSLLLARYPQLGLQVANVGVSGDTVRNLAARWRRDLLERSPDWVSVQIGVNDAWRHLEGPRRQAVPLGEYEATYARLLEQTLEVGVAGLVLMEPFLVEPDRGDRFRLLLDGYVAAVRRLAERYRTLLVPTQVAFDEVLAHQPASFWAPDRIHPTPPGHAVIARAWLRTVGYGDI